ncbi:MAG: adenine-specific DNA methylase [Lachnospiraceae bacterium]|nr:adenine-specific DNA methylase [Ruminococcus sp.]MCM1277224.1 adenine-specific DNA methylase [Lachnospiraceae bacterium]
MIKFNREWAMPNHQTFQIKPIKEIVERYKSMCLSDNPSAVIIDPFANGSKIANVTNDLNPEYQTDFCMDALDFLKTLENNSVDMVLYDPPYSPRQVSEWYKSFGMTVNRETTQDSYWSKQKAEIQRITKTNGIEISCGWNSGGMGKKYGFAIEEILLVPHGGNHNDTIVVVDRKGNAV